MTEFHQNLVQIQVTGQIFFDNPHRQYIENKREITQQPAGFAPLQ